MSNQNEPGLIINGRRYEIPSDYTIGETRAIKRISGLRIHQFGDALGESDPDAIAALVFVVMRRENPSITEAEVDAISFTGIVAEEESGEVPPAEPPEGGIGSDSDGMLAESDSPSTSEPSRSPDESLETSPDSSGERGLATSIPG